MIASPLALPRISRAEAAAARVRHAPRAVLTVGEGRHRLRLDAATHDGFGPERACITFSWGSYVLLVRCAMDLPRTAVATLDPALDAAFMPADLASLLFEAACLQVVTAGERSSGHDLGIVDLRADPDGPVGEGLCLTLEDGSRTWRLNVTSARADGGLAAVLDFWPVAPRPMERLPLPAALRLGTTRLTLAAVKSLRHDDAVLLQTQRHGGMVVVAEAWLAAAERQGTAWRLGEVPRPARFKHEREWTMREEPEPGNQTDPLTDPDGLPVQLAFDVGRLDVTLGDLRRFGVGAVLELNRSLEDLVRISANGVLIGHGALVDVEGSVGVRIVRLFDHG